MTVRAYSSLDSGAPALSGSRLIDRLRQVLMACLVDGYGSKPGAGWTVGHNHADGFSLGNGEGFINFVHQSGSVVTVYVMESITSGAAALAVGDNRRSGPWYEGSTQTGRQYLVCGSVVNGSSPHWSVVADALTVSLLVSGSAASADLSGVAGNAATLHFGRYINPSGLHAFCSLGGSPVTSGANDAWGFQGMALRHPLTGVVEQGLDPRYRASAAAFSNAGGATARNSNVIDKLHPVRAAIECYGAGVSGGTNTSAAIYAGRLRGIIADPFMACLPASQLLPLLGGANTWQGRVTLLTLPGGKQVMPFMPTTAERSAFVSLDPADWG